MRTWWSGAVHCSEVPECVEKVIVLGDSRGLERSEQGQSSVGDKLIVFELHEIQFSSRRSSSLLISGNFGRFTFGNVFLVAT